MAIPSPELLGSGEGCFEQSSKLGEVSQGLHLNVPVGNRTVACSEPVGCETPYLMAIPSPELLGSGEGCFELRSKLGEVSQGLQRDILLSKYRRGGWEGGFPLQWDLPTTHTQSVIALN
jgi:hypothetical protein